MPKPPQGVNKQETSIDGRRLLGRWLQQRIDAGESIEIVPEETTRRAAGHDGDPLPLEKRGAAVTGNAAVAPTKKRSAAAAVVPAPEETPCVEGSSVSVDPDDSMQRIASEVNACTRCRLHETRDKSVPGVGPDDSGLVFIGEGPGADEDRKGEPFVGRAGQLLTKIIAAVELSREEVFITNIVKCRPPNNRDPRPDEIEACEPYLKRQLRVLDPKVICTLGRHAAMTLLQTKESMAKLRTDERSYEGVRLFPTYHPAALLRNPQWKRPVWEDIQKVRKAYDEPREKS